MIAKLLICVIFNWFLISCSTNVTYQKPICIFENQLDSVIIIKNGNNYGELHLALSYDTLSEEFRYTDKFCTPIVIDQKIYFF